MSVSSRHALRGIATTPSDHFIVTVAQGTSCQRTGLAALTSTSALITRIVINVLITAWTLLAGEFKRMKNLNHWPFHSIDSNVYSASTAPVPKECNWTMIRNHVRTLTNVKLTCHAHIFAKILKRGSFDHKWKWEILLTFSSTCFHSFLCKCPEGFVLDTDMRTCIDFDECSTEKHNCSDLCLNTDGGYRCSCPSGLVLSSDERTCETSDPCSVDNGGCSQICNFHQDHTVCSCRNGFEIDNDDKTQCSDINECKRENK